MVTGHKTAIKRKAPPAPLRWLVERGYLPAGASVLDYGCGHGPWYGHDGWDPYHRQDIDVLFKHDFVVSCYVANVVRPCELDLYLEAVEDYGKTCFVVVRRDLPKEGKQGKGCWQYYVELPEGWTSVKKTKGYEIYQKG